MKQIIKKKIIRNIKIIKFIINYYIKNKLIKVKKKKINIQKR